MAGLLGWKARESTLESPLPNAAVRLGRAFENQLNSILTDRLIVAEPSAPLVPAESLDELAGTSSTAQVARGPG